MSVQAQNPIGMLWSQADWCLYRFLESFDADDHDQAAKWWSSLEKATHLLVVHVGTSTSNSDEELQKLLDPEGEVPKRRGKPSGREVNLGYGRYKNRAVSQGLEPMSYDEWVEAQQQLAGASGPDAEA
jgi:hypothetical protein